MVHPNQNQTIQPRYLVAHGKIWPLLSPLPSGDSVLIVVNYFSRYYEVEVMRSTTSEKVIECLEKIFTTHGLPLSLRGDNGPQLSSDTFEQYLKNQGIEHRRTTPLWPQANGEVERQNKSLLKRMRKAQAEGKEWKKELRKYLVAYRSTPHTTTDVSPAELLFGRKMRTKLPDLREESTASEMRDRDGEIEAKVKQYADKRRNAQESDLIPGDKVLVSGETSYRHRLLQSLMMLLLKMGTMLLLNLQKVFKVCETQPM